MTFSTLALVLVLGSAGPLLAWRANWHVPIVIGELFAGIIFGASGFRVLHPDEPTFAFLADMGFALVMFVAGTHVPVRSAEVRSALGTGLLRAALVGLCAAGAGYGIASWFDLPHGAIYAVLMASSSAAVVLPIIDSQQLTGPAVLQMTAQVAVADTVGVVALPLVIDPAHAGRAALGALAVAAAAGVMLGALRYLDRIGLRRRAEQISEQRKFALELRIGLVLLFALAAVATRAGVSIMLAGFAAGLAVSATGEPRRVAEQLFAITEGFLGPLFFVWLGARLNLREFSEQPHLIVLGLALGAGAVAVHIAMRAVGQPIPLGMLAAAQIGLPVAAVTVGGQLHVLRPGEGAAIMLGALVTVAAAGIGGALAARKTAQAPTAH
ncbi:cation:proton antiporter [Nocardia stercoris]|uniref:Cation:proton antiporter n=1 Tax=Nocardia stercoris TaxID=2483361 RepID=A0A3M2LGY6_9NOCA|nr:cation:proton antiporter [Nocardia stercoris]RMI34028.1 cation:proton antiporter [Nocardia stercoris]